MEETYLIRHGMVEDAEAMATANVSAFQTNYKGLLSDVFINDLEINESTANFQRGISKGNRGLYVIEKDNKVVGYINGGKARDEGPLSECVEIYALYVHPDFQGQGFGEKLLSHFLHNQSIRFNNAKYAYLRALKSAIEARKFYEKMGGELFDEEGHDAPVLGEGAKVVGYKFPLST